MFDEYLDRLVSFSKRHVRFYVANVGAKTWANVRDLGLFVRFHRLELYDDGVFLYRLRYPNLFVRYYRPFLFDFDRFRLTFYFDLLLLCLFASLFYLLGDLFHDFHFFANFFFYFYGTRPLYFYLRHYVVNVDRIGGLQVDKVVAGHLVRGVLRVLDRHVPIYFYFDLYFYNDFYPNDLFYLHFLRLDDEPFDYNVGNYEAFAFTASDSAATTETAPI